MSAAIDLADDVALARHIADRAGEILLTIQQSGLLAGKSLGKAGDQIANAFILAALRHHRPDDGILSEEEKDDAARLALPLQVVRSRRGR